MVATQSGNPTFTIDHSGALRFAGEDIYDVDLYFDLIAHEIPLGGAVFPMQDGRKN